MSQTAALPTPCSASLQLVQAGVTTIPGDSVGGTPSTVQSVTGLHGWDISESTGLAGAKIRIWDGTGTGAGNYLLAVIDLGVNGQSDETMPSPAQIRNNAIYVQVVSGSVEGSVFWG